MSRYIRTFEDFIGEMRKEIYSVKRLAEDEGWGVYDNEAKTFVSEFVKRGDAVMDKIERNRTVNGVSPNEPIPYEILAQASPPL